MTGNSRRFAVALLFALIASRLTAQSSSSGLLEGEVTDTTGAILRDAAITVTNESTLGDRTLATNSLGLFTAPLLTPGLYTVVIAKPGFASRTYTHVPVDVASTLAMHIHLAAGSTQAITIKADLDLDSTPPNAGSVTDHALVAGLPLATRNYTQILGLNSGVASDVADAGALGRGNTSFTGGTFGFSSNGAATNDNNFQIDGTDVNDIQGSGYLSRGVPIPNPDSIDEFRVSTQPYDASLGRNAGANINVILRSGTSKPHGSLFEYLRNDAFNANSFFRNRTDQPRAALKQNQFGGTLGGRIPHTPLLGFGSYQETRQTNGVDPSCSSSVALPPLTNDRSAAGLGAVFQGQRGYFQNAFGGVGPAILADGSNISPVALALLQRKNADGSYLFPTPQIVSASGPFDARGFSTFSLPCPYTERQGVANLDGAVSPRNRISLHSFASNSSTVETLPSALLGGAILPASPYGITDRFRTITLADTSVLRPTLLNDLRFGFNRVRVTTIQQRPFSFSSVGATVPSFDDPSPLLTVADAAIGGNGGDFTGALNTFNMQDVLTYTRGRHFFHLGGGITRIQDNQPVLSFYGADLFLSFADLLLGQNAAENGTAALCVYIGCGAGYSDIAYALDTPGTVTREYRILSGNTYLQDDIRLTQRLTANLGLRFERLGDLADRLGHNTSFDPTLADHNPPASGSLAGYTVPKNYTGPVPVGVTRLNNNYGINGDNQNTWQPRVGLSWQLPGGDRQILHAGYGVFRSRITADSYNQSVDTQPFARLRQFQGTDPVSASLTLAQPLPPFTETLPSFSPYCPPASSACTEEPDFKGLAPNTQPPLVQRYNLDIETRLAKDLNFDLGYVGARGEHILTQVSINQAGLASPSSPINGVTTNTLANLPLRVPLPGWTVANLTQIQSSGSSLYNSLQASLRQRTTSHGEFLVSYTWARDLTDTTDGVTSGHGGAILGNQDDPGSSYGPDDFLREQRLVASYLIHLPSPHRALLHSTFGGWQLAGVVVAQSGHRLPVTYQNHFSVVGVVNDRASLVQGCHPQREGSARSRLSEWFNTACFAAPPVVGQDGVAQGFGNAPVGLIHGPGQTNVDAALRRTFNLGEDARMEFRAESFNLFNHAIFSDPDTELTSATFGQVQSTSVNPRLLQLALRLEF
jgi:hypothetical protein